MKQEYVVIENNNKLYVLQQKGLALLPKTNPVATRLPTNKDPQRSSNHWGHEFGKHYHFTLYIENHVRLVIAPEIFA